LRCLLRLSLNARIYPIGHELLCFLPLFTSPLESDVRIDAKGDQFFLAAECVFEAPPATLGRSDEEEEAPTVKELVGSVFRPWRS
jgi:hypothetical protein